MSSNPATAFLELLKSDASWVLSTWYTVVTKGSKAFNVEDLKKPNALPLALRFLTYIAVFTFLIEVPVAALLKLPYDKPAYVTSSIVLNLVLWLVYASILHVAMKALGGKGEFRESLAIFCFSTALFVPVLVFQWPIIHHIMPSMGRGEPLPANYLEGLTSGEAFRFQVLWLISTAFLAYFFVVVIAALRKTHRLQDARGALAGLVGILGIAAVIAFVSFPMHKVIYTAFN